LKVFKAKKLHEKLLLRGVELERVSCRSKFSQRGKNKNIKDLCTFQVISKDYLSNQNKYVKDNVNKKNKKHLIWHNADGFAIVYSLFLVAIAAIIGAVIFRVIDNSKKNSQINLEEDSVAIYMSSALETFLPALDLAESKYMEFIHNCDPSVSFLDALLIGHQCASIGSIPVFEPSDLVLLDPAERNLFQYLGRWMINQNSVQAPAQNAVVRIPLVAPYAVEFYLDGIIPQKSWIIMNAILLKDGVQVYTRKVSLYLKTQDYMLHVESSNGRISQELQNPQNQCLTGAWMEFNTLRGGACAPLDLVGGINGLASYRDRIFGFINYNGMVVDLTIPFPTSNQVNENGTIAGVPVFPQYRRDNLIGADDIEVIGEDSGDPQLYYIRGQGSTVHIGYSDYASNSNYHVCDLGALGWSQSYSGMGVSIGSNRLIPTLSSNPSVTSANFTLKSDSGDFFNVRVRSQRSAANYDPSLPAAAKITNATFSRTFVCIVQKVNLPPSPEYRRTLGMSTQRVMERKRFSLL